MNLLIILLNRGINLLKYPIAIVFALLTFELFHVLYEILEIIYHHQRFYQSLFHGVGAYFVLWIVVFKNSNGKWFLTIEHELTHTLFALLTFHKIVDFKATDSFGGHMQFSGVGGGNWLITIAPYFFPTFSMIIIGFIYLAQSQYYPILITLLGYSIVYHIHSTYMETSSQQPDIEEVGLTFSLLFLPAANLFALIGILSAIPNDRVDFMKISEHLYSYAVLHFLNLLDFAKELIGSSFNIFLSNF